MRDMARSDGSIGFLNLLVAALTGLAVFAALLVWGVPGLDPAVWDETAVVAGLRPARTVFPGFWRLLVGWAFPLLGVRESISALSVAGAAVGGCCVAVFCLIVRHVLALLVRVDRHYPFWSDLIAPIFSAFAALAFGMSDPFRNIVRTLSPEEVRLAVFLLIVYGSLRWFAAGGRWRLLTVMAAMGFLSSETPVAFLLPVLFVVAYLGVRACVMDGLFPWPERLPELEEMPLWRMFFLFFGGLAGGIWLNALSFEAFGGLEANGLTRADVFLRYATGYWRVIAGAATLVGWMLGVCFCVLPFVVAVRIAPLVVNDERPMPFRLGVMMVSVGFLALLQTEVFPSARFWTLVSGHVLVFSGFLLALLMLCAAMTLAICGAAFAFECRRTYLKGKLGTPGFAFCWMVPAVALLLTVGMALRLPRPVETEVRRIVDEAVRETVRECGDAKWLFTDGHLDAAIEIEALAEGREIRTLNMMSGGSAWDVAVRQRGLDPSSDEYAAAETGVPVLLRTWAGECPGRMDEAALQLGFDLWKRDRREMPKASGLVARTKGIDDAEAERGVARAVELSKRILEVAPKADEVPAPLAAALSAVNWRLSRFARMRDDMKLAGDLEENNSALKRMLTAVENERMRTFMQMTPREGLHMALSRADFTVARRYAAAVLAYDEEDAEANFGMGMAELSLGRYAAAENYLKRCLVRRPEEPATLNNLSIICRKLGRYKESEDYARRALKRLPDSPEVKRTLADILAITEKNRRNQTPGAESADK